MSDENKRNEKGPHEVLEAIAGGRMTIEGVRGLPDGSGFATGRMPLPKGHWLYVEGDNVPPMPFRMGTADPNRKNVAESIGRAVRYAIRCATVNGTEMDFDPDALVQNAVVGMLGHWTPDGLSRCLSERYPDPVPEPSGLPLRERCNVRQPEDVIREVLQHVPEDRPDLREHLTYLLDMADYSPPENRSYAFFRLAVVLNDSLPRPPKTDWQKKVYTIVTGKEPK